MYMNVADGSQNGMVDWQASHQSELDGDSNQSPCTFRFKLYSPAVVSDALFRSVL